MQELESFGVGAGAILRMAGVQHDGNVGDGFPDHMREFESRVFVGGPGPGKLHIGDHGQGDDYGRRPVCGLDGDDADDLLRHVHAHDGAAINAAKPCKETIRNGRRANSLTVKRPDT